MSVFRTRDALTGMYSQQKKSRHIVPVLFRDMWELVFTVLVWYVMRFGMCDIIEQQQFIEFSRPLYFSTLLLFLCTCNLVNYISITCYRLVF